MRWTALGRPDQVGTWQLMSRLGTGSVAEVYAARPIHASTQTNCDYAVKLIKPSLRQEPLAQASLRNEGLAGSAISDPHVVPVLQSSTDADTSFLVMPRLEGAILSDALKSTGRLPIPHAIWIARQACQGLSEFHRAAWVHGDIKPGNIHLSVDGHATLIDLGCAVRVGSRDADSRFLLSGTLDYMAPERLMSRHQTSIASDIYSLGITLFETLTGRLPFAEAHSARVAEAHLREIPPSPRTFVPQLPRSVAQLLQKMLAKQPERRPDVEDELPSTLRRLEIETFGLR